MAPSRTPACGRRRTEVCRARYCRRFEHGSGSALTAEGNGYYSGIAPNAGPGTRYKFRLDGGDAFPDPASRFQPDGPHGAVGGRRPVRLCRGGIAGLARRVDRRAGESARCTSGRSRRPERIAAAIERLPDLVDIGITVLEIMPVAEFAGQFGWGYDGVDLYAPTHLYGTPDDLRALVDAAHAAGARRDPRRRLQPFRSGRQLSRAVLASSTSARNATEWGRRSTSTVRTRRRCGSFSRERQLLDRGVPFRWPAARRDAADLRHVDADIS